MTYINPSYTTTVDEEKRLENHRKRAKVTHI
nr:MAG TPA: hypothetical protein [Caudoviricetes sp.]DAT11550.1 MAG TPA: hypothetical protein [Caudoviricetes sp.]